MSAQTDDLAGCCHLPVHNVVAIASGKGGVGKSTVAVNVAVALAQSGARVGLLDADIYGPNVPTMMGVDRLPQPKDNKLIPGGCIWREVDVDRFPGQTRAAA